MEARLALFWRCLRLFSLRSHHSTEQWEIAIPQSLLLAQGSEEEAHLRHWARVQTRLYEVRDRIPLGAFAAGPLVGIPGAPTWPLCCTCEP